MALKQEMQAAELLAAPRGAGEHQRAYDYVRGQTQRLIEPLTPEDMVGQSMVDASPTKWHIAHTTWFFETLVLKAFVDDYRIYHKDFSYLYNSYYNSLGERMVRAQRGLETRPAFEEVLAYRAYVDEHIANLLVRADRDEALLRRLSPFLTLGLHHEQQHQELALMDILHLFSHNPLFPAYQTSPPTLMREAPRHRWQNYEGGLVRNGYDGDGFHYDHEGPRHECFLVPYRLGSRLVTNGEWLEFIEDNGYGRHELWLDDGWRWLHKHDVSCPLYWHRVDESWHVMSLYGLMPLSEHTPVVHVSYYEADAYCRWRGYRLPTEMEWEHAASTYSTQGRVQGNFLDSGYYHPQVAESEDCHQFFGDVWEYTSSAFQAYPGYRRLEGAVGEYNGKFMSGQMVMRGGCCVTPQGHMRPSYRNFFYPSMRWQFGGVRMAADVE